MKHVAYWIAAARRWSHEVSRRQMSNQFKITSFVLLAIGLCTSTLVATTCPYSPQGDPFGDPFGGGDKKQDAGDPFAGGGAGGGDPFGNAGGANPATPITGVPTGPIDLPKATSAVVLAIRETKPTTPSQIISALRIMVDTRNFDEAKVYLDRLIAAGIDDATSFQLVQEIGSDFIVRMIRTKQISPNGASFGRSLLASAQKHLTSETQLQTYFNDLTAESNTARINAERNLQLAGISGLAFLVANAAKADSDPLDLYESVAASISKRIAVPLQAVLETGTEPQKAFAISVLGRAKLQKSLVYWLSPLFNPSTPESLRQAAITAFKRTLGGVPDLPEAKRFLNRRIVSLNNGSKPYSVDAFGKVEFWNWTPDGKFMSNKIETDMAKALTLEKYGKALFEIDKQDKSSEVIYLATQVNALKALGKKPVVDSLAERNLTAVDSDSWIAAMDYCVKNKLLDGAVAAAEIIGKIGTEEILRTSDFSPLVRAMESGDRQLRFACTSAIAKLKPHRSFPGANCFLDSLVFFAGTTGQRRALIAHPKFNESQSLIGTLSQQGINAAAATSGRELYRLATGDSDVEFMLISDAIDQPKIGELIMQLRSNPALRNIPIGIMSQQHKHKMNMRIAEIDGKAIAMRQPYRVSFSVGQILPDSDLEINNAIIVWSVLSDLLEQAIDQANRSVAIQILSTMRVAYDDNLSKLTVDNSAIVRALQNTDALIVRKATDLFLRIKNGKPPYEKPIQQPTASGKVLIVHPNESEISPLIKQLKTVGYDTAVIDSLDRAIKTIPKISGLKFVIGSSEFGSLAKTQLKKALEKRFRLNPMPLTFVDRADSYRESPVAKPVFVYQIEKLMMMNGGRIWSEIDRTQHANECLDFLYEVAKDRDAYRYMDPVRHQQRLIDALRNRSITPNVLKVLGQIATPKAQKAIVNFASDNVQSIELRTEAAEALEVAIEKRGILLTKADILEQFDRYNKSGPLGEPTQKILGRLLDIIEAPSQSN